MERSSLLADLNLNTFIAFDFETTGLDPNTDKVIEIAAIRFEDGNPTDRFVSLINPEIPISSFISDITGITNEMVSDAPTEDNIVDSFFEFLGDTPMVAHNTSFDWKFLSSMEERHGKWLPERNFYDTLPLSRSFLFFQPTHNLSAVSDYYGLSIAEAHRAEADTENCGRIFIELVMEASSYPLELVSKIVALIKPFDVYNKALFIDLANTLARTGDLKNGLVVSPIDKTMSNNVFYHEGTETIDSLEVKNVFQENGLLSQTFNRFEERKNQIKYAQFVESVLLENIGIGIVEAGTGLGKSMAYLFSGLKRAQTYENNGPVVISCYTKHLQDQLFTKDLPQLAAALNVPIQAAVLKGRNNYLCKTRLNWLLGSGEKLLDGEDAVTLLPILVWLQWTKTGDLDECPGFMGPKIFKLRAMVQSEPGFCTTHLCGRHNGCFFGPLKKAVYNAQILIVNHAMLISETRAKQAVNSNGTGFLPPHETVIIDEAHNLINAAYNQLTMILDKRAMSFFLDRVDPQKPSSSRWNNSLKSVGGLHSELIKLRDDLVVAVERGRKSLSEFFEKLGDQIKDRFNPNAQYSGKIIIKNLMEEFGPVDGELSALSHEFSAVLVAVERLKDKLLSLDEKREDYPELHQLFDHGEILITEALSLIQNLTRNQNEEWVYWFEGVFRNYSGGPTSFVVTIQGAPIDLADDLTRGLFSTIENCILTSATLRTDDTFEYFLRRTGLDNVKFNRKKLAVFESPFIYHEQVDYFQYSHTDSQNPSLIAEIVYACHKYYDKRIMALFTSRDTLNKTLAALKQIPGGKDLPVFAQTRGTSRQGIIRGMHQNKNGILFGTNAFWEGVDLPGDLLEILIITKIPFDVPTEPVIKAYGARLEAKGDNKFMQFALPEAIIRFRQGFGRLIRTTYDEGIFIVLDDRIVNKRYGSLFSDAVPTQMKVFNRVEELVS